MDVVAGSRKAKESELMPTSQIGAKWTAEDPGESVLGEWIELGRKLRSASGEEILALIGRVEMYLVDELNNEQYPSPYYIYHNYTEYVRGYAKTILKAARTELRKKNSERLG